MEEIVNLASEELFALFVRQLHTSLVLVVSSIISFDIQLLVRQAMVE